MLHVIYFFHRDMVMCSFLSSVGGVLCSASRCLLLLAVLCCTYGPLIGTSELLKETPDIRQGPLDMHVIDGAGAIFWCFVAGNPVPDVTWSVKGQIIGLNRARFMVLNAPHGSVLRIDPTRFDEDNEAAVECTARNALGEKRSAARLEVYKSGQLLPVGFPQIRDSPALQVIEKDSDVTLICQAQAQPDPTYVWLKDYLPIDMNSPRFQLAGGNLRIKNAMTTDEGKYICIARNQLGSIESFEASLFVRVRRFPPSFSIMPQAKEVLPKGAVNLTCVAVGSPMPTVRWLDSRGDPLVAGEAKVGRDTLMLVHIQASASYTCRATNELGSVEHSVTVTVKELPRPPTNLNVLDIRPNTAKLEFRRSDSLGVTSYTVMLRDKGSASSTAAIDAEDNNQADWRQLPNVEQTAEGHLVKLNLTNLLPWTQYQVKVVAVSSVGRSGDSAVLLFTTAELAPGTAPTELRARALTSHTVRVSWQAPLKPNGQIKGYNIYYSANHDDQISNWEIVRQQSSVKTEMDLGGLRFNQTYFVVISAHNAAGEGPITDKLPVIVVPGVPGQPRNFQAIVLGPNKVQTSWSKPLIDSGLSIQDYQLLVQSTRTGETQTVLLAGTDVTSYLLEGLVPDTVYKLHLRARSSQGAGILSKEVAVRTAEFIPEEAPLDFRAANVDSNSMRLCWRPPSPQRRNGAIVVYNLFINSTRLNINATSSGELLEDQCHLADSLQPWTLHNVKVQAATSVGVGPFSQTLQVQTKESVPNPPEKVSLRLSPESLGQEFILEWSPPRQPKGIIRHFRVQWVALRSELGQVAGIWQKATVKVSESLEGMNQQRYYYTIKDLSPKTWYRVQVAAATTAGEGRWAQPNPLCTLGLLPSAPLQLQVTSEEARMDQRLFVAISATWEAPATTNGELRRYHITWRIVDPQGLPAEIGSAIVRTPETVWRSSSSSTFRLGVSYNFSVTAENIEGMGAAAFVILRTLEGAPSRVPESLVLNRKDKNSVQITWSPPPLEHRNGIILGYEVKYTDRSSGEEVGIFNSTLLFLQVRDLDPQVEYIFFVRAFTSRGSSSWTPGVLLPRATTPVGLAPPPTGLHFSRNGPNSGILTWQMGGSEVTGFRIYYSTIDEIDESQWSSIDVAPVTSAVIRNLVPESNYIFRIKSRDVNNQYGSWSKLFTGGAYIPDSSQWQVRQLSCPSMNLASNSLKVTWDNPSSSAGLDQFLVSYQGRRMFVNDLDSHVKQSLPISDRKSVQFQRSYTHQSITLNDLQPYTEYSIDVITKYARTSSVIGAERSSAVKVVCRTLAAKPPSIRAPQIIWKSNNSSLLFTLRLSRISGINGPLGMLYLIVAPLQDYGAIEPQHIPFTKLAKLNRDQADDIYIAHQWQGKEFDKALQDTVSRTQLSYVDVVLGQTEVRHGRRRRSVTSNINEDLLEVFNQPLKPRRSYRAFVRGCVTNLRLSSGCTDSPWSAIFGSNLPLPPLSSTATGDVSAPGNAETPRQNVFVIVAMIGTGFVLIGILVLAVGCIMTRGSMPCCDASTSMASKNGRHQRTYSSGTSALHLHQNMHFSALPSGSLTPQLALDAAQKQPLISAQQSIGMSPPSSLCGGAASSSIGATGSVGSPRGDPVEMRRLNYQNAAMMNHPAIPIGQLANHVASLKANENLQFSSEYESIDPGQQFTWEHSNLEVNKPKNRYANVIAYDHSRVILSLVDNEPGSDYINANYMDGYRKQNAYIATQGPLPETFIDFWRMIWEQRCATVVMMTKLEERARIKCDQYWPSKGQENHGPITVTHIDTLDLAYYTIRTFLLSRPNYSDEKRELRHFQFTAWPDHGVPDHPTPLLMFLRRVRASVNMVEAGPVVVHCSAGVGRTGAFILIDSMLERIRQEKTVDIYGHVTCLRSQRNYMVQTEDQYVFIHDALLESIDSGNTEVPARNLQHHLQKLRGAGAGEGLQLEFRKLSQFKMKQTAVQVSANLTVNKLKNRLVNVLPYESCRVCLQPIRGVEGSDYVNASFVDGYKSRRAYIATQGPLPDTTEDLWRMLWEHNSTIVVMLTKLRELGREKCHPYWPSERSARYQYFVVDPIAEYNMPSYIIREFKVTDARDGQSRTVRQFQFTEWPEQGVPASGEAFIDFIGQVHKTKEQFGQEGPITVHCSAGVGRTGVFLALSVALERMRYEGVVDMFQTVKMLRTQRPVMVQSEDQYQFCYTAALEYLSSFDHYAN